MLCNPSRDLNEGHMATPVGVPRGMAAYCGVSEWQGLPSCGHWGRNKFRVRVKVRVKVSVRLGLGVRIEVRVRVKVRFRSAPGPSAGRGFPGWLGQELCRSELWLLSHCEQEPGDGDQAAKALICP